MNCQVMRRYWSDTAQDRTMKQRGSWKESLFECSCALVEQREIRRARPRLYRASTVQQKYRGTAGWQGPKHGLRPTPADTIRVSVMTESI